MSRSGFGESSTARQHECRRLILELLALRGGEMSAAEMREALPDRPASTLAYHLLVLTNAGEIASRKDGASVRYALAK